MSTEPGIVCAYFGRPDECCECGFYNQTGGQFCSDECAARHADRAAAQEVARLAQRAREDAFAEAAAELRARGHSDEEIDVLLAGMPT